MLRVALPLVVLALVAPFALAAPTVPVPTCAPAHAELAFGGYVYYHDCTQVDGKACVLVTYYGGSGIKGGFECRAYVTL